MDVSASIKVNTQFVEQQSDINARRYVFAYTITISNVGQSAFQLMSRHWIIRDANNKSEEVYGEGVVGQQPLIEPGKEFTYTSGAVLDTEMGTMEGKYFVQLADGTETSISIPKFVLSVPRVLH